jgi:hypothetical protein
MAPERNPPIVPQFYAPSVYYITAISNGNNTTVTTATTHNYVIGQKVRFHIPPTYGERELNEQEAYVLSIPSATQVLVGIDSITYNAFIPSPSYGPTKPQICAIGDVNTGSINSTGRISNGTTIPGAFRNTSPIEGTWLS